MALVSDCCGHPVVGNSDDYGICPDCKEHCEYVEEKEEAPSVAFHSCIATSNHNKNC